VGLVVEELMSGESRPAQLGRRYSITSSVPCHWRKQNSRGKLNNEPTEERSLRDRVEKLERLVGELALENELPKKRLQRSVSQPQRNGRSYGYGGVSVSPSGGGVN